MKRRDFIPLVSGAVAAWAIPGARSSRRYR